MSGAYSTPITRDAPPMRQAPIRKAQLRNPNAGQRNMQLEVQAVLDQAKPFQALVAGANEITQTFLKADMQNQLTSAELGLRTVTESMLANMQAMPVARELSSVDPKTGQPQTTYSPVHESSLKSFNSLILHERDKIAKRLPRAARDQFLAGTVAYVSSAQAQAESINRKQHVSYLQGTVYSNVQTASTPQSVDAVLSGDDARLVYQPDELFKMGQARKKELAGVYFATRVLGIESRAELESFEGFLLNEHSLSKTDEGGAQIVDPQDMKDANYLQYADADLRFKLIEKINSKINRLDKQAEEEKKQNKRDALAAIYSNPDSKIHNPDKWLMMVGMDMIYADDIPDLEKAMEAAIIARTRAAPETSIQLRNHILANIGNYEYRLEALYAMPLSPDFAKEAIEKRQRYDDGIIDWKDKNNPAGNKGARANQLFENAFYRKDGGFMESIMGMSGLQAQQLADRYYLAAKELDEFATAEIDLASSDSEYTMQEALDNIYIKAVELADKERSYAALAKTDSAFDKAAQAGFTGDSSQYLKYQTWSRNNNNVTYEGVLDMPPSVTRDRQARELQSLGWTIPDGFIGQKPETQTAEEAQGVVGSVFNWFKGD